MENLLLMGNSSVPTIDFNINTGVLFIKGKSRCFSGGEVEYFEPVIQWVQDYSSSPAENTIMNVQMVYFCSATSKSLLYIFRILEKIYLSGKNVTINWYHEIDDIDMIVDGEEYKSILKLPFSFIAVEKLEV